MTCHTRTRRGAILALALAVVTVLLLLVGVMVRSVVLFDRQARHAEEREQAKWLVESAIQRAIRTAKSPDYRGETWQVPADIVGQSTVVVVRVEPANDSKPRRVIVDVVVPDANPARTIVSREIELLPVL